MFDSIRLRLFIVPFAYTLLAGCAGESLSPVRGKVIVNGKPAVGASVMFFPEGSTDINMMPGSGVVEADGSFTIASGMKAGMKPGKYVVTVVWPDPAKAPTAAQRMAGANPNDAPDVLGGRYATREKSPLRADVTAKATELEPFNLK